MALVVGLAQKQQCLRAERASFAAAGRAGCHMATEQGASTWPAGSPGNRREPQLRTVRLQVGVHHGHDAVSGGLLVASFISADFLLRTTPLLLVFAGFCPLRYRCDEVFDKIVAVSSSHILCWLSVLFLRQIWNLLSRDPFQMPTMRSLSQYRMETSSIMCPAQEFPREAAHHIRPVCQAAPIQGA